MAHGKSPESAAAGHTASASNAPEVKLAEPWLRGTLADVPVLTRAVLHALQLAREDIERWCGGLSDPELNARPGSVAPVAFHLRHIVRSADRLLTYADARQLSADQIAALKSELLEEASKAELFAEFRAGIESAASRVRAFNPSTFEEPRKVGKLQLPTTVGSLLIHVADHTQRHVGQAITTARIATAARV